MRRSLLQFATFIWTGSAVCITNAAAFAIVSTTRTHLYSSSSTSSTALLAETTPASTASSRRRRTFFLAALASPFPSVLVTQVANAGLLDEYGSDPTKIVDKKAIESASVVKPADVQIDPTLRGSYYYPTAKKRYLPRIQKVTAEIVNVPEAIAANDWEAVAEFAKTAENAVLPLQLYQSSLDGQGLSMSNSYAKVMKEDALQYENAFKLFAKAIKSNDSETALQAILDMGVAIADYRKQGRLYNDDGKSIPTVDEMRRMAMRRQTGQYNYAP